MATERRVKLKSSDNIILKVDELVACESNTLKAIIELDIQTDREILLPNVFCKILSIAMQYCAYQLEVRNSSDETPPAPWFQIENLDHSTLVKLIAAANYLDIRELVELAGQKFADMIMDKDPEEIRRTFNITTEFPRDKDKAQKRESLGTSSSNHECHYTKNDNKHKRHETRLVSKRKQPTDASVARGPE